MSQWRLLPAADQELLVRVANHGDRAEADRRRHLIAAPVGRDCDANERRDRQLLVLLEPLLAQEILRLDRIIRACAWATLSQEEIEAGRVAAGPRSAASPPKAPPPAKVNGTHQEVSASRETTVRAAQSNPMHVARTSPGPETSRRRSDDRGAGEAVPPVPACTASAVDFLRHLLGHGERMGREVEALAWG